MGFGDKYREGLVRKKSRLSWKKKLQGEPPLEQDGLSEEDIWDLMEDEFLRSLGYGSEEKNDGSS